jgi:hypothetical protein
MDPKLIGAFGVLSMCCICSSIVSGALMSGGEGAGAGAGSGSGGGADPVIEKYRYVRIYREMPTVLDAGGHWMNPAEVQVFSGDVNVSQGKTVTGSSLYADQFPHSHLVDGIMDNFAHTNNGAIEWFLIDLGQEYEIDKVVITNRTSGSQARMENTKIQLSKTSDMTTSEDSRVITKAEAPSASFTWTVATDTIVAA